MLHERSRTALIASALIGMAAPAQAETAEADVELAYAADTILVTGQRQLSDAGTKTDTPLIETPQAISVITSDRFLAMGALNLQDTLRYSAGVRTEAYGLDTRGDYGFVRGTEPGIYQDGLRRSFGFRVGSKPEIFTLSRVEVLRGPSSMLYGQAPTGGLVNSVTKTPLFDFAAEAFASYGTFDRKEAGFDITGPVAGDTLAARLVGVWRDSDSQTDFVDERRWAISPSLLWTPGPDTSLTLIGLVQDDDSGWTGQFLPYVSTLLADSHPLGALPWNRNLGEPSTDKVDLNSEWITAQFAHRFSPAVQFRQNLRYERFKSDQVLHYADVYSSPTAPYVDPADPYLNLFFPSYAALGNDRVLHRFAYGEVYRSKALTSDSQLQLDFATGPLKHKLLAGVDYTHYRARDRSAFAASFSGFDENGDPIPPGTTPIDAYNPVYGNVVPLTYFDSPEAKQTQLGFYLQDQVSAFDRATIILGLRRDRATNATQGGTRFVDTAWTTRIGFMYDLGGGLVPYLSYSESFQPIAGADIFNNPFRPTRGRQYEAGVKWQPDAQTFVTATVYDLKDSGRLVNDPDNPINQIQAGTVKTRGFELEASRSVADDFDIIATYSYTRAKDSNTRDQIAGGASRITTDQFESVPKHLASLWGMKTIGLQGDTRLRFGAGVRYVGTSWSTSFDASATPFTLATPDYVLADAMIGLARGPWSAALNAANLFDKKYYTTCLGRGDCFLGLRRTVNLRVGYRF